MNKKQSAKKLKTKFLKGEIQKLAYEAERYRREAEAKKKSFETLRRCFLTQQAYIAYAIMQSGKEDMTVDFDEISKLCDDFLAEKRYIAISGEEKKIKIEKAFRPADDEAEAIKQAEKDIQNGDVFDISAALEQANASIADMKERGDNAIGSDVLEFMDSFLTAEEISESDLRVSLIGELVKARQEQGISQKRLEELSGVKQPIIARMEKGNTNPQLSTLIKVLAPLGKTLAIVPLNKQ